MLAVSCIAVFLFLFILSAEGNVTRLRLFGGDESYGRLQIQIEGQWATVCDDGWNDVNSGLACNELGFLYGRMSYNSNYTDEGEDVPIGLDDVTCNSGDKRISECYHRPYFTHDCSHSEDVFLRCSNVQEIVTGLRLAGGNESYGRLQIQIDGQWATVCDDGWNDVNSRIACKELGFPYGRMSYNSINTNEGEDVPIGLDDVSCNSGNERISECYHKPYFIHDCSHGEDVFLNCSNDEQTYQSSSDQTYQSSGNQTNQYSGNSGESVVTGLRLAGGNETYGRLDIQIDGEWATVCDDNWSYINTRLACNELGYPYGTMFSNNMNTTADPGLRIGLDDVSCNDYHQRISQCYHLPYFVHDCAHYEDVFLSCSNELPASDPENDGFSNADYAEPSTASYSPGPN